MGTFEILILACGTLVFLVVTWIVSLKARRLHGIYRFFSFESILVLIILNWRFWFVAPFELRQMISWATLFGSLIPVAAGTRRLLVYGKPSGQLENTKELVTTGIYSLIRHPLYASLILLGCGVFLKRVTLVTAACVLVNLVALLATALREEMEMKEKFGIKYEVYKKTTKRFIPYIF